MEQGNSSQEAQLLPRRIGWACILMLSDPAMFTSVVPDGLLLLTAGDSDYPAVPVSAVLQLII